MAGCKDLFFSILDVRFAREATLELACPMERVHKCDSRPSLGWERSLRREWWRRKDQDPSEFSPLQGQLPCPLTPNETWQWSQEKVLCCLSPLVRPDSLGT
jgi:hypothetical protein